MKAVVVAALLCAVPAAAQRPSHDGASAAVLEWDRRQDDTAGYAKELVRIEVLTADGVKYGNVQLLYEPGFSRIKDLEARTIHADGTVVPYRGTPYEKLLLKTSARRVMASTFVLPDVQPGSVIEYRYVRAWSRRLVSPNPSWDVQREIPIVKERLWFKPARPSVFRYHGLDRQMQNAGDHFELELENVPQYRDEPFAPPPSQVRGRIEVVEDAGDAKWLSRDAERAVASVRDLPRFDDLRQIYAHAQSMKRSHDDITHAFVAIARAAGFDACVARAADRGDAAFTSLLAVVDGRFYDPGTPFAPFGLLPWRIAGAAALKLDPKHASFVQTPLPTPNDALVRREADLRIEGDVVRGTVTVTWAGQSALVRRLEMKNDAERAARLARESEVRDWLPAGSIVKLTSLDGLRSIDTPLVATLDVEMPDAASFTGSRVVMPMAVFMSTTKNPFAAEQRQNPIDFQYPRRIEDEVTLRLPDGYTVESVPQAATDDRRVLAYQTEWSAAGKSVTAKRAFVINAVVLDTKSYGEVREFWANVLTADQEPLVLRKPLATAAE